ncbi:MAG: hypothetical protein WCA45_06960 [Thiobacillaceae bacterium]
MRRPCFAKDGLAGCGGSPCLLKADMARMSGLMQVCFAALFSTGDAGHCYH